LDIAIASAGKHKHPLLSHQPASGNLYNQHCIKDFFNIPVKTMKSDNLGRHLVTLKICTLAWGLKYRWDSDGRSTYTKI